MRVLLVGGSGFVGMNVAEALVARGDDVALFDPGDIPADAAAALAKGPGNYEHVDGDVRNEAALAAACEGRDAAIFAAAITAGATRDLDRAAEIFNVNTLGVARALKAAREAGVARFVYTSSASVYGEVSGAADALGEVEPSAVPETVYGISKYAAERLTVRARRTLGQDTRTLRLGSVFGPWERATGVRDTLSPIFQVTDAARSGTPVVLPRAGRRDWIYSRDIAGGIIAALDHPDGFDGVINVAPGVEWTVADWCERLSDRFAAFAFEIAGAGSRATIDYHGPTDRSPLSNRRLVEELGFQPTFDIDTAFADLMAWIAEREDGR